ncbi:aldo/keto reductase [Bacteroidota bacterium]
MKPKMRKFTRKEFIKTSSMGTMAAGMLAATPMSLLAGSKELAKSTLGKTGIKVAKLGIGAPRVQEPSVLQYALDNGINFIDTGRSYANGKNEIMVGEVVKGKRKEIVIQSKVVINPDIENLNNESISAKIKDTFNTSLEESLIALQTDYIDVMLFHDGSTNEWVYHEAVLEAFTKAKQEGKILASGYSAHFNLNDRIVEHNNDPFYDVLMFSFNPHGGYKKPNRDYKWDHEALIEGLTKASDNGTGIVAMKTCLAGPYCCEGDSEKTYSGAVKWVLQQPYIHTSAVAMANFQQLDEHLNVQRS